MSSLSPLPLKVGVMSPSSYGSAARGPIIPMSNWGLSSLDEFFVIISNIITIVVIRINRTDCREDTCMHALCWVLVALKPCGSVCVKDKLQGLLSGQMKT